MLLHCHHCHYYYTEHNYSWSTRNLVRDLLTIYVSLTTTIQESLALIPKTDWCKIFELLDTISDANEKNQSLALIISSFTNRLRKEAMLQPLHQQSLLLRCKWWQPDAIFWFIHNTRVTCCASNSVAIVDECFPSLSSSSTWSSTSTQSIIRMIEINATLASSFCFV